MGVPPNHGYILIEISNIDDPFGDLWKPPYIHTVTM